MREAAASLAGGQHHDPHGILGAHAGPASHTVAVRAWQPGAETVTVVVGARRIAMRRQAPGLFATSLRRKTVPAYRLEVVRDGSSELVDDPYRFLPTIGELDLHLIGEGRHERLWDVLGSHAATVDGTDGVRFAVWAPSARGVGVAGDHNGWDASHHPMRSLGSSGVWELFLPGLQSGAVYKYGILGADGVATMRADPVAREAEVPPRTASIVAGSGFSWGDGAWMAERGSRQSASSPISVYEVHLGSWRQGLGYRELADELSAYVADLGFTHVELLPVMSHPFGGSWGYQVTGYYAPAAALGSPDDLRLLIDRLHQHGIGVLLDWVPAHFPRDEFALARFDGTELYEHADPRRGAHPDWGTLIFNYGRNEVRNFLIANALYWLEEFHVDGLRVDAVASMLYLDYSREEGQWLPNEHGGNENLEAVAFLRELNAVTYGNHPGIAMIAEESTAWPGVSRPVDHGGLGFGFKWNMGFMHDTLSYFAHEPVHRRFHHNTLTLPMLYAYSENYVLPISHDEVVHGKGSLLGRMPGDDWQQFANLRAYLAYMWAHPGKKLLFMGCEIGQRGEWNHDASVDWAALEGPQHRGVRDLVRDLNRLMHAHPALSLRDTEAEGFRWIDVANADENVVAFVREAAGDEVVCVANLSPVPRVAYCLGLPRAATWHELLNSDATIYGGSGMGNLGAVEALREPVREWPASATVTLPPLSVVLLGT